MKNICAVRKKQANAWKSAAIYNKAFIIIFNKIITKREKH